MLSVKMKSLLFAIRNNDDTTKIDEAIEKDRTILISYPATDPCNASLFVAFSEMFEEAFRRTHKIEYLNETISAYRQATENSFLQPLRFLMHSKLSRPLLHCLVFFPGYRMQDLTDALELLSQEARDARGYLPHRFSSACRWAHYARAFQDPTITTAYEAAMSLMQDTLHFSPALQLQHATLVTRDNTHSMPGGYASHQVDLGQLEEAIETLERGRALLWSEMGHFYTSIDQILQTDPDLGHKFAAVNRELEELTKSVPPNHKLSMDDGADVDLRAVGPFGRLVLKQCQLLKERSPSPPPEIREQESASRAPQYELCCALRGNAVQLRGRNLPNGGVSLADVGLVNVRMGIVRVVVRIRGIKCEGRVASKRGRGDPALGHRGKCESVVSPVRVRPHCGRRTGVVNILCELEEGVRLCLPFS